MRKFENKDREALASFFVAILCIGLASGCKDKMVERKSDEAMPQQSIEQVLEKHTDELMSIKGVVGTAIGECDGKPCIKVFVSKKTPELEKQIPSTLEGYRVSVEESGEFKAL